MAGDHDRPNRAGRTLSRRQAIAGGSALLAAGGTLVWVGDPVRAAVSVDELTIPDASFERDDLDPVVAVTAGYEYDVGTTAVSALRFELVVDETVVASEQLRTDEPTLSGETELSGRIADSDAWALADFAPAIGETLERDLTVTLRFAVLGSDDSAIVSDSASETVTVTVAHPQDSAYTASVGGEGEIRTATGE